MAKMQNAIERYTQIIKYHGFIRGLRRVADQITQVDMYDFINSLNTRQILSGDEFLSTLGDVDAPSIMHYQPIYTAAIRNPLRYLVDNFPVVGASSACFLDLGCGRGKALHVARRVLHHATIIGVDLHADLLRSAASNLRLPVLYKTDGQPKNETYIANESKEKLLCGNVNNVSYDEMLNKFDALIILNKNSFDKYTTENTIKKIRDACNGKSVFYVYSNPVFEALLKGYACIFKMRGWHKNWNTNVFDISPL